MTPPTTRRIASILPLLFILIPVTQACTDDSIVKSKLHTAFLDQLTLIPTAVRAAFHDCITTFEELPGTPLKGGCNGSLRLDIELLFPENVRLRDYTNVVKDAVSGTCVSVADGFQIAVELALELTTGDTYAPQLCGRGRTDAIIPDRTTGNIPTPGDSYSQQKSFFLSKGFSVKEFIVAIVGGHALGGFFSGNTKLNFTPNPHVFTIGFAENMVHKIVNGSALAGHHTLASDDELATDAESVKYLKHYAGEEPEGGGLYDHSLGLTRLKTDFVAFLVKLSQKGS